MGGSGTTYIGVATSTTSDLAAFVSVTNIRLGPGDSGPNWFHAARGDLSRNGITEAFLESDHEWCLYLDGDMRFPPDLLTRLKAHGKPFVGGLYFRRELDPMWPLAFEYSDPPQLPLTPLFEYPDRGLVRVDATGSGCWLVHRDVFEPVQAEMQRTIKEKIGLDLEHVPYIMDGACPELRGDYGRMGADVRFCHYARRAGFDIWLDCDPELDIGHFSHVPIDRGMYETPHQRGARLTSKIGTYRAIAESMKGKKGMDEERIQARIKQVKAQMAQIEAQIDQERRLQAESRQRQSELQKKHLGSQGIIRGLELALEDGPAIAKAAGNDG